LSSYRFIGSHCEIWDTKYVFTRFGQLVEIPDDLAQDAIAHGAALVPAKTFDALSFTPDELKKFGKTGLHAKAPADFLTKRDAAWMKLREPAIPVEDKVQDKAAEPVITHTAQETK